MAIRTCPTCGVDQTVTDENISDTLVACFEGGSNYWIEKVNPPTVWPKGASYASDVPALGGTIVIVEQETRREFGLWKSLMVNGIIRAAQHYKKTVEGFMEDQDADSADVALQFALFGEIVYG